MGEVIDFIPRRNRQPFGCVVVTGGMFTDCLFTYCHGASCHVCLEWKSRQSPTHPCHGGPMLNDKLTQKPKPYFWRTMFYVAVLMAGPLIMAKVMGVL